MTLTGNNVITLRKLTSKVTAEKGIAPLATLFHLKMVFNIQRIRKLKLIHHMFYLQ